MSGKRARRRRIEGGGFGGKPVGIDTMDGLVQYLNRLCYAGKLRAIAVAYVDPAGNDYQLMAVAHLDIAASIAVAKGLRQLSEMLDRDALDGN